MDNEKKNTKAETIRQFAQLTNKLFLLETKRQETKVENIEEKRKIIQEEKEILNGLIQVFNTIKSQKPIFDKFIQRVENITKKRATFFFNDFFSKVDAEINPKGFLFMKKKPLMKILEQEEQILLYPQEQQEQINLQRPKRVWRTAAAGVALSILLGIASPAFALDFTKHDGKEVKDIDPVSMLMNIERDMGGKGSLEKLISLDENSPTMSPELSDIVKLTKACIMDLKNNNQNNDKTPETKIEVKKEVENKVFSYVDLSPEDQKYVEDIKRELKTMIGAYYKFKSGSFEKKALENHHNRVKTEIGGHLTFEEMFNYFEKQKGDMKDIYENLGRDIRDAIMGCEGDVKNLGKILSK